jgi:hypothetical protein
VGDDILLTPGLKIDINEQPYTCVSGNGQVTRDLVARTSTEDAPGGSRVKPSTIRRLQLTIVAQRDPDADYFGPPLNIFDPAGLWVRIWHNDRGDPSNVTDIPVFHAGQQSFDWNMQGSAAQGVTLQGENDGDFWLSGEV